MNLLEEAGIDARKRAGENIQALGGNLLDQAGITSGDTSKVNPKVLEAGGDETRQKLLDELNNNMSVFEKFAVGAGRGLTTIARGVGLAEPEDAITKEAFGRLADDSFAAQAGEIVGEATPFLLPGVAASAIPSTLGKVAAAATIGGTEGNLITRGKGGGLDDQIIGTTIGSVLAGTIEAISPVLGRMGNALFRKLGRKPTGPLLTPDGAPTPEFRQALDETGTSFDQLTKDAFADVNKQGVDPEQAARSARFASEEIPASAGDITQDFAQQSSEQRLLSSATGDAAEPLRQAKLGQSEAFQNKVNELVDSLGVPDEAGDSIKDALSGRKKVLSKQKSDLYKQVADASPEVANMPLIPDDIAAAVPSSDTLDDLAITSPDSVKQIKLALARFGIDKSDEAGDLLASSKIEAQPLTIGNFDRFRKILGNIERSDQTGAAGVMTNPIRNALDAESELVERSLGDLADDSIVQTLREARGVVTQIKTEFDPKSIVGRLIDRKKNSSIPVVEASKVAKDLLSPTAPIENLQRVMASLRSSGDKGKKAIGDLQASAVMNALEAALKAPTRKTSGIETLGSNEFVKSLNKLGKEKLDLLFQGNENALGRLTNFKSIAQDITPASGAVPKGSAAVNMDIVNRILSLPGLAAVRDTVNFLVTAGADDRAVRKALNAKPMFKRVISDLEKDFPAIASSIGVAIAVPKLDATNNEEL